MKTQAVASSLDENAAALPNGSGGATHVQPVLFRLDAVPATSENRHRILERVRRLNRSLKESGTPFRLRLL